MALTTCKPSNSRKEQLTMLKIQAEMQTIQQEVQNARELRKRPQSNRKKKKKQRKPKPKKSEPIKRTRFKYTPLGDFLLKYCPVEYELITGIKKERLNVSADMVETIAYKSNNPIFHTAEFRKVLGDYRKYKTKTPNKVQFNLDSEIRAIKYKLKLTD